MHEAKPPFAATSGPVPCKVAFVGEAWGEKENILGKPLVGGSGRELGQMLQDAKWPDILEYSCPEPSEIQMAQWWAAQPIFITNTFAFRPQGNKMIFLCGSKKDVGGKNYKHGPLEFGKYLFPEYLTELDRLKAELETVKPNLVIALGSKATWALLGTSVLTPVRGSVAESTLIPGLKVLPTFHPANIFRQWSNRPILIADLIKAKGEMTFPEIRRPKREILVNPTLEDIRAFLTFVRLNPSALMAFDIETSCRTITCISFAISHDYALVIPFHNPEAPSGNYWKTKEEEVAAWLLVKEILETPNPKLGQNVLYDLQYLTKIGFKVRNVVQDTMLLHHSLYPEMDKGLGFLGSLYSNEVSWKLMRKRKGTEIVKAEE